MQRDSKRILIVDDDEAIRRLLKRLLQSEYELGEAAAGQQALEILPGVLPDLVLLDIMMPGIDGYEVCRRIKAIRSDVQIIMVSSMSSAGQQSRAFEVGADDYLVKPFDPQDLRARVRLHFQLREATAGVSAILRRN